MGSLYFVIYFSIDHTLTYNVHISSHLSFYNTQCRYQASKLRMVVDPSSESGTATSASNSSSSDQHLKYLTNSQLLHLQLRDPEMRLHFLTQLLIMTSYLTSTIATNGPKVIKVTEIARALAAIRKRAEVLMKQTPPNGASHLNTVEWILTEREAMWRKWKSNKCQPDIESFGVQKGKEDGPESEEAKKRKRRRLMMSGPLGGGGATADPTSSAAGASDLYSYRLDVENDLPSVAKKMAECVPPLSTFLEEYVEALDPENGIEAEYHPRNDKPFAWRAMRLLARDHLGSFGEVSRKDGDFERVVRSIWKEDKDITIPGDEPKVEEVVDFDELKAKENAEASTKAKASKAAESEKKNDEEEADVNVSGTEDAPSVGEPGNGSMDEDEEQVIKSEEDKQTEFQKIAQEMGLIADGGEVVDGDGKDGAASIEDNKEAAVSEPEKDDEEGGNKSGKKKKKNNRGRKRKADSIDETDKKEPGDAKVQQEAKKAKTDNNPPRGGSSGRGGPGGRGGGSGGRGGGGGQQNQRGGPSQGNVGRGPSPPNRGGGGGPQGGGGRDWDRGRGPPRGRDWDRGPGGPGGGDGRRRSQSGGRRGRR